MGFEKFNFKAKSTKTIVNELLDAFKKFTAKFHRGSTFQPIPEERRLRNSHSYNSEDKKGGDDDKKGFKWNRLKDLIIIKK